MAVGLGENDPYNNMESGKDEIRPEFLNDSKDRKKDAVKKAADDLDAAETAAAENGLTAQTGKDVENVRKGEEAVGGFFSGKGKIADKKTKGRFAGMFKKRGPVIAIFLAVFGVGGIMTGAQSLMPFAIEEMIIQKFNSIGISSTMASDSWLDTQLNEGVRLTNLKEGETENLFAFSPYQVEEFKKQGIIVVNGVGGSETSITALLYQKGDQYIPVVGSDYLGRSGLVGAIQAASGINNIGTPISAKEALADADFKMPYTTASKAWRGGSSGWFDQIMSNITETKLSIHRNRWARYISRAISGMSEEFKKTASSAVKKQTSDYLKNVDVPETVKDADGKVVSSSDLEVGDVFVTDDGINVTVTGKTVNEDTGEVTIMASNVDEVTNGVSSVSGLSKVLNSKAVKVASAVADYGCAVIEGLMSIYTVVSAYQSLQFLNLVSGYLEAVDKVKAGVGSESPIHTYSGNLTTKADTVDLSTTGETPSENTISEGDMGEVKSEVVATKTAMESAGMVNLFGNVPIDANDTSVQNVNVESLMSKASLLTGNVQLTAQAYEACGYVKMATAAVDLVTTALAFVPIFGQGIKFAQISLKAVGKVAIQVAMTMAFYFIIPYVAQKVANSLIKDAATEWFGEDLGNAMISGASKYLGGNGSSGGQGPGDTEKVVGYLNERNAVIAEEAKYQRTIRSPFDTSSPYTFFGSLAYALMPYSFSSSGVMGTIKNMSNITTFSITSLMPSAVAVDVNQELTSKGDCPLLESTGAVGDAFCNPYIITDVDTIGLSPVAVRDTVVNMHNTEGEFASIDIKAGVGPENFNADGSIRKGSDLAKYITYCGQRTSQYGIQDASIAELEGNEDVFSSVIGYVPVLNNAAAIFDAVRDKIKSKWITGKACIVSESNPDWAQNKYYARYAENERLLENINPGYKSTITAYVEKEYQENPVDDTFEGTLARFAGMTNDQLEDTLALMDYYLFLEEYRPEERYAFGEPAIKEEKNLIFESEDKVAQNYFILLDQISFADVRNRTFAI